ncbi:hypothetical protein J4573_02605 [Actinomadura barringtoniae]|uniref:Lipoprotein n=1 Tax=Actinomadura barringtoniae TaxID=1427535 RepID=A0A939PAZ9_9ACTN|nr:hypothetical protein [Actinomadura barringtoniae]MBO2445969.1 hypothetical protein [Actinomadura barringtoniae]
MRIGAARVAAGGALLFGLGASGACGVLGGGNSGQVCADTKAAFQRYITQVRGTSAAAPAQWRQATEQLAGQLGTLGKKANDSDLKKTLNDESGRLSAAAAGVGNGDVSQLNSVMTETPQRIGKACS